MKTTNSFLLRTFAAIVGFPITQKNHTE